MLLILVMLVGVSVVTLLGAVALGSIGLGMFGLMHMIFPHAARVCTIVEAVLLTFLAALALFYELKEWWMFNERHVVISKSDSSTYR